MGGDSISTNKTLISTKYRLEKVHLGNFYAIIVFHSENIFKLYD